MLETGKPFTFDCLVARVSVEGKNYGLTTCVQQVIKSSLFENKLYRTVFLG